MVQPLLPLLTLLICYILLPSLAISNADAGPSMQWWCSQTPYPNSCTHFMGHLAHANHVEESHIHHVSIKVALDHAVQARARAIRLGLMYLDKNEQAAWSNCIELYEATVHQLNLTLKLQPLHPNSHFDEFSWLGAALTNLDTCRTSFAEVNVSGSGIEPLLTHVSELISNSLAITRLARRNLHGPGISPNDSIRSGRVSRLSNRKFGPWADPYPFLPVGHQEDSYNRRLPDWVLPKDRKLLEVSEREVKADLVVAKDGTGDFSSISKAVDEASKGSGNKRFVIYVKKGVYKEYVNVGMRNLMLVGDGIGKTVITGSRSAGGGSTTYNSATFAVTGERFIARGITFRNTAGPAKHQAVALRSSSDLSVFYQCSFQGYQDTLYAHSLRQFYRECKIYGTVDFIFGNAAVVFQNCNIYVRRPMSQQKNTITAQGRTDPNQNTGISIQNCRVTAAKDLRPVRSSFQTFLGRPLKEYSRTVYMETYMDDLISPAGWLEWSGDFALETLFYGEFRNTGPGSNTSKRVKWGGYHIITDPSTALEFTARILIAGEMWLPSSGLPFKLDL
ncbi:pectinesterase-like [Elaeis guineensis]|uniref:Pectinesterase n=1 Tax=Elaeis guineensis var. tenera TaxID=51953 RepID=A0A6J0PMN1_ELAGV|nr:pectinesterase-like [Elaeis guineensis]